MIRPNRNSSSSTVVQRPGLLRRAEQHLVGEDLQRVEQIPRRGPPQRRPPRGPWNRTGADPCRRAAGRPGRRGARGLVLGSASRRRNSGCAVSRSATCISSADRPVSPSTVENRLVTALEPLAQRRRAPPGWRRASRLATCLRSLRPRPGAAMNESTVARTCASSASRWSTIFSASSTASVPISARSSRTIAPRWLASCSSPRAMIRADSSCACRAQLLDRALGLGAGVLADLRRLGARLLEGVLVRLLRLFEPLLGLFGVLDLLADHLLPLAQRPLDRAAGCSGRGAEDQQERDELGDERRVRAPGSCPTARLDVAMRVCRRPTCWRGRRRTAPRRRG